MTEERRALIEIATGKIVNVVVYDSTKTWTIPSGYNLLSLTDSLSASIGDTWDGEKIIKSELTVADKFNNTIINTGNYLGDNTANRGIPHGLKTIPKLVNIQTITGKAFIMVIATATITPTSLSTGPSVKAADITNFYVGNKATYEDSANAVGYTYYWVALA